MVSEKRRGGLEPPFFHSLVTSLGQTRSFATRGGTVKECRAASSVTGWRPIIPTPIERGHGLPITRRFTFAMFLMYT